MIKIVFNPRNDKDIAAMDVSSEKPENNIKKESVSILFYSK